MGRAQEYNNFELIIYKANQEFLNESKPDGESKMAITNQTEAPHPTAKKTHSSQLGGRGPWDLRFWSSFRSVLAPKKNCGFSVLSSVAVCRFSFF